jgi:hypothetical protein
LAILQEEVIEGTSIKERKKMDSHGASKPFSKSGSGNSPGKSPEQGKSDVKKSPYSSKGKAQGEKSSALMAYRKAKGLCYKCGERWGPQHSCPESVPLHVVEELWQLVSDKEEQLSKSAGNSDSDSGEELMAISFQAANGTYSGKTVKLECHIHQHKAIVLIDSGSSHNFISEQFATAIPNWKTLQRAIDVKVADGGILKCTHEIVYCNWIVQGVQFQTSFKIIPLKCYDAILGMDWLEPLSPMRIHWSQKWLSFDYQGNNVQIQGLPANSQCLYTTGDQLHSLLKQDEIWCVVQLYAVEAEDRQEQGLLPDIQTLVEEFKELFDEPKGLPPNRNMTHTIPLLTGAQPFILRPYRYTPAQKDEIEKQVAKLLQDQLIQTSSSPYASPVLLVKKKNGEWRLCVDFRKLNAYTIKNKFPLPVIEELFEELVGAKWFTNLDLRSGFHQIMVEEGDRYKTTFQTHCGHFEYKVMPYGLTGAPATFQAIMNHILAPLLRKCVVVFIDDILIYSKAYEEHIHHVKQVFELLREHQFKVRLSKCSFAKGQLRYLGHVISAEGVGTDPEKVKDVKNWPNPTNVKEVRAFPWFSWLL